MAPRPLWSGVIAFGLVTVPVRLFTAVHEHRLEFHLVHEPDDGPIGYQKICKLEDEPVPDDEIAKAFEFQPGKLVHVGDEDFEAAQVEGHRSIELEDFVPYDEIDPTYFAHTYLVGPGDGAEKTYALLVRAMAESGLAGIGKFVMRNRQYLGCLRVRGTTLTLEQLHFADEVDPPKGVLPSRLPAVSKRELAMALDLIEAFAGTWKPEKYRDTYTAALRKVIKAKVAGKEVHRAPEPEPEEQPDLFEALRRSVEEMRRGAKRPTRSSRNGSGKLAGVTRKELEARARKLGVEGRSKMTKEQLAEAVARAA
jgi:DNA end-binding protein Ku